MTVVGSHLFYVGIDCIYFLLVDFIAIFSCLEIVIVGATGAAVILAQCSEINCLLFDFIC